MIFSKYGEFMIRKKKFFTNKNKIKYKINEIDNFLYDLIGYS